MRALIIFLITLNTTISFSQVVFKHADFFDILERLPENHFPTTSIDQIKAKYYSNREVRKSNNYYDFNQPHPNMTIKWDSSNLWDEIFIDTAYKLLIIRNLTEEVFVKAFNNSYPYLIGYHISYVDPIAHSPIKTQFYQLNRAEELIDITDQLFKNLDFCLDNYWAKTLSYFKGTSKEIKCDPDNLLFNFTKTDTIWIMDCQYDIMESYGIDTLFDKRLVNDVYIARKYILKDKKFIPQKIRCE